MQERKLVRTLPRFIAAQAEMVASLARAFARSEREPAPMEPYKTIAEGIANHQHVRGVELLRIVYETGGAAIAASEEEIRAARLKPARRGIFIEPTSATAIAVLEKIAYQIREDEIIVVSLTGSGLKAPL